MAHSLMRELCTRTVPVDSIHDLKKGDHIKFDRLAFTHHAIVTDVFPERDKFEVIEMGLTLDQRRKIGLKRSLEKMTKWRKMIPVIYKYHYRNVERLSREKTLAIVENLLENRDKIPYDFLESEHIATFCVTGTHSSEQISRFELFTTAAMLGTLVVAGISLLRQ